MTIDPVIPVVLSAIAIAVSGVSFYFRYRRSKKSEQVRICREIWNWITPQNRIIHEWIFEQDINTKEARMRLKRAMDSLEKDLGYFIFFVDKGEINAPDILEYYIGRRSEVDSNIRMVSQYPDVKEYDETKLILALINRYKELTNKEDKKSNSSKN